jgi:hypothetical protein
MVRFVGGAQMDAVATAPTNAWLQAVHRTQSAPHPQVNGVPDERTMTDVIERALRGGGLDSTDPQWVAPIRTGQQVDLTV